MKTLLLPVFLILFSAASGAQTPADSIPARKHPTLPALVINGTDGSTRYNTFDLPEGAPTLLFFFSPDCDHCGMDADTLAGFMRQHPALQVVALSIAPVDKIRDFLAAHRLTGIKGLTSGQDAYNVMPGFFKVQYFPYFALYNGKKQLVQTWDGGVKWSELRGLL